VALAGAYVCLSSGFVERNARDFTILLSEHVFGSNDQPLLEDIELLICHDNEYESTLTILI
jgi:hypothetical protein